MLFHGYILRDWFGSNSNKTKYEYINLIIIHSYIKFYTDYWKYQNKNMQNYTVKKEKLMEDIQWILEVYTNSNKIGI